MKSIQKYIEKYAEDEAEYLSNIPPQFGCEHCIVIPACNEEKDFLIRLIESELARNTLLILVINQTNNIHKEVSEKNIELSNFASNFDLLWENQNLYLVDTGHLHILLVDRFSEGKEISTKEGVGRARKIGCDLAISLFEKGALKSPWIYSTDADAHLPKNYFTVEKEQAAALVFDFSHRGEPGEVLKATLLYERAIKYFKRGLEWAGSPYAFYTLGSTVAVHVDAYCKVRGFPPRAGAEDFYLLNKLAKVGKIISCPEVCVDLEARLSERVPFGTGPAVSKIIASATAGESYRYYDPYIFKELKNILSQLPELRLACFNKREPGAFLSSDCLHALKSIKYESFEAHCRKQNLNQEQFELSFHTWFDAFQTLKFIHSLQRSGYHSIELDQCEKQLQELCAKNA